jgi:hypothetical protein
VSVAIDTTEPGHAFMIKLVPTARRVASLLLHAALGADPKHPPTQQAPT